MPSYIILKNRLNVNMNLCHVNQSINFNEAGNVNYFLIREQAKWITQNRFFTIFHLCIFELVPRMRVYAQLISISHYRKGAPAVMIQVRVLFAFTENKRTLCFKERTQVYSVGSEIIVSKGGFNKSKLQISKWI